MITKMTITPFEEGNLGAGAEVHVVQNGNMTVLRMTLGAKEATKIGEALTSRTSLTLSSTAAAWVDEAKFTEEMN